MKRSVAKFIGVSLLLGGLPAALVLSPTEAFAVGEQNARLRGSVLESGTNVPMPGAKVTISSDALIGGPKRTVTDEDGKFDFPSVPHGSYVVVVAYEGLRPIKRRVSLDLGETQNLRILFAAELEASETTTIVEERKRIDTEKVGTGRVLKAEDQGKIASGRTYQSIVQQLPGVVGGSNPVMGGASLRHNRYLIDGLDTTDPVTNTFALNFNFDAIAQIDTQIAAVDAQYNSMGGVLNLITKRGSDKFHVDASFYFNHQSLSSGARAGTQLYESKLLDQSDPRPPQARYQVNLNLSGPLIKQKLWFYLSTEFRYSLSSVVPGPPLNSQHPSQWSWVLLPRLKLSFQPVQRHRIEVSFNTDPAKFFNAQQANTYATESEYDQRQGGVAGNINYDWFIRDNLIFALQTGLQWNQLYITAHNDDYANSNHFDSASTVRWNAATAFRLQDDQRWRFQFDPTIKWVKKGWLGEHTFKAGVQISYLRRYSYQATPGNSVYTDNTNQSADGGILVRDPTSYDPPSGCNPLQPNPRPGSMATPCFQQTTYDPALVLVRQAYSAGAFAQDVWKPTNWLTIIPGLRIDWGRADNSLGEVVQNLLGFGPRLGINIDLTRDNKTVLKFGYGRANEVASLLTTSSADAAVKQSIWNWNRATNRFDSFNYSQGGADGYDLRGRCPDGTITKECGNSKLSLSGPRADFVTLSLERELFNNVAGSIVYTYRNLQGMWDDFELNARRTLDGSNYTTFGDPRYGGIYAYRPNQSLYRLYNGIDFMINGAPTPNWNFFISYTLSWLSGTGDDQISVLADDPARDFKYTGYLADDHRHQVKVNGSYSWKGLTIGTNIAYLSGGPATRLYFLTGIGGYDYGFYSWRGLDPNADPNDIRKWTELRSPDIMTIDLRVQYDAFALIKQHLSLIVDLFNTLDIITPVVAGSNQFGFENRNAATYGQVTSRQTPLRVQLAIRYQY